MSTIALLATGTVTAAAGALAMYLPAHLRYTDARKFWAAGEREFDRAEQVRAEVERTRNLPWYWPTDPDAPTIEAAPAEHEAEVLRVDYPTSELRLADGLARLADEVGLVQATTDPVCCTGHGDEPCGEDSGLVPPYCCGDCPDQTAPVVRALSDEPHYDDEDAPSDDTERRYLWLLVAVAVAAGWWWAVCGWFRARWAALRAKLRRRTNKPYTGRHWVSDVQHTGQFPIVKATGGPVNTVPYIEEPPGLIIPAQRKAAE
jgi:hypothetical protein